MIVAAGLRVRPMAAPSRPATHATLSRPWRAGALPRFRWRCDGYSTTVSLRDGATVSSLRSACDTS